MLCSCIQVCQQETASVILRFNKMWAVYFPDWKKNHKTKTKRTGTKLNWEQLRLTMKTMTQEHEHESEQEHKKTQDLT